MDALAHQKAALDEIVARAKAYFAGGWIGLPIKPRWASLIVGPTGTGKTTVAAMAADAVDSSMLRVSLPSWMPLGAHNRGSKETISVIAAHVAKHDRTILATDEIEKIFGNSDHSLGGSGDGWRAYLVNELFDVLDGRWPVGMKDSDGYEMSADAVNELTTKLRETVFVVGIGTFQNWFDSSNTRRSMGFGAEIDPPNDQISTEIIAKKLSREMANRFNSTLIRIPELQADDYRRIANEAAAKLPLRMQQAFRTEVQQRLPRAIDEKKGVRFLEEAMMEVLKNLPPEPTNKIAELVKSGIFRTSDMEPCTL